MTNPIGSGPFRYVATERESGHRVVFDRNPDYIPRGEPPDGAAGARIVKVDRVRWQIMPDPTTAANAMVTGEVDFWDTVTSDLVPFLKQPRRHGPPHHLAAVGRVDPAELRTAAVQRCQRAPGAGAADRPEGVHAGGRRRHAVVHLLLVQHLRLAVRHRGRIGSRTASRTSPRRSSCWRMPATRANRSWSSARRNCRSSTWCRRSWRNAARHRCERRSADGRLDDGVPTPDAARARAAGT